jgi:hypothetical protein
MLYTCQCVYKQYIYYIYAMVHAHVQYTYNIMYVPCLNIIHVILETAIVYTLYYDLAARGPRTKLFDDGKMP